ncbi:MAG: tetratricopeptide repeat protein [Nannocystales bacterium]
MATPSPAPPPGASLVLSVSEPTPSDRGDSDVPMRGSGESTPSGFLPPDEVLGRYVVLYRLGAGGMGVVYAAYDPKLDRKVAIKLLRKASSDPSKRKRAQERLMAEARALARLSHPNVIAVHDVAVHDGRIVVAMEFVDGETLTSRLAREPLPWRAVVKLMIQAGEGLAAAHGAGLVHRDFKPDNVMLARDGRVHVMDFGLAREFELDDGQLSLSEKGPAPRAAVRSRLAGTPAYMAPEQHRGLPVDGRTDQFSFCVTLYEALYGHRPFVADGAQAILALIDQADVPGPPSHVKVPGRLRAIVLKGLAADPDQRYSSMQTLLDELERVSALRRPQFAALAGIGGTAVLLGGWGVAAGFADEDVVAVEPCAGAEQRFLPAWDQARRSAIEARFSNTGQPYAEATWIAVSSELDAYRGSWVEMHTDACEATRVRQEQSDAMLDLRMECLARRLDEFDALTELLADADPELIRTGVAATAKLVPVRVCADTDLLKAPVPVPDDPDVRERIHDLRASLARVKVHEDAGRYARGLALAKVAVQRARVVGHAPVLAEALLREGKLALATGNTDRSEPLLREAIQTASAGRDDLTAARAWIALVGVVGHGQARAEPATELIAAARAAVARAGAPVEQQVQLAIATGATFVQQGRLEDAQDQFQLALERQRAASGPEHPTMGRIYNNLAAVNLLRQDAHAAKRNLERAIELQERTHGPRHPSVAPMKANVGALLLRQGRTRESKELLTESLQVWEASGARNEVYIGQANLSLAQAELFDGHAEAAESLARRSLTTFEATNAHHPDVARALTMLGASVHAQGRAAEALDLLERALVVGEKTLSEDHDDLASLLTDLGSVQLDLGQVDAALGSLERALSIRATRPGIPTELPRLRFAMARASQATDLPRALRLARSARAGFEALPQEHPMRRHLNAVDAWIAEHATEAG